MNKNNSYYRQLELDSLIEFSQLISSRLDLDFILGNILLPLMGKMLISSGAVLLKAQGVESNDIYKVESGKGIDSKYIKSEVRAEFPRQAYFTAYKLKSFSDFFNRSRLEHFFKIYYNKKLIGILCLGQKLKNAELSNSEISFIETLLNISASSIENSLKYNEIIRLNENLNSKISQLKSLFELSKEFHSNFQEKEKIIKLLKFTLFGNFGIKDLLIISRHRADKYSLLNSTITFPEKFLNKSFLQNITKTQLIKYITKKNSFISFLAENNFECIIPIVRDSEAETIVCIGKKLNKTSYTENDIEFLTSIINLSILSIDNTLLFREFLEKQKIEDDLLIARDIQMRLLPKKIPHIKNYDSYAHTIPAKQVGGDYYDIVKLGESKFAFVIADVSGKGTPASLLMANLQSAVHSFLKIYDERKYNITEIVKFINELIYDNTDSDKFISFFIGILDADKNEILYVNAGHNPPLIYKNGQFKKLDIGGLLLGVDNRGVEYEQGKIKIDKNDVVIFFTDGVTETLNIENREFAESRMKKIISENHSSSAFKIIGELERALRLFSDKREQYDDITTIVLRRVN